MNLQQAAWLKKPYSDQDPDYLKVVAWREHQDEVEVEYQRDRREYRHHKVATAIGWIIILLVLFGAWRFGHGQELPTAPMDRTEKALLLADLGSRALDVYSTHEMLTQGYHELILPKFIANHTPVMAAYSGATVLADYWLARRLEKSGHRKLAHVATMIDIGQDLPGAVHNLFLRRR